jgi:hypothetical protein
MALNAFSCGIIAPFIKGRVLCLGVPVVLLRDEGCEAIFGVTPRKKVKAPHWAGLQETPDPYDLIDQLGGELTCVDAIAHDGREVIADLNYPQDLGEFDLVIDAGTTEHCFNVGQALVTTAYSARVGGRVLNTNPVSMGNHGFYNFNPTLLIDFYKVNGFKVRLLELRDLDGNGELQEYRAANRFDVKNAVAMYCLAKRMEKVPLRYPIQSKYL